MRLEVKQEHWADLNRLMCLICDNEEKVEIEKVNYRSVQGKLDHLQQEQVRLEVKQEYWADLILLNFVIHELR